MTSFWKKLAIAFALALAAAAALRAARSSGEASTKTPLAPPDLKESEVSPARGDSGHLEGAKSARSLIPSSAWLIVDFSTSLAESAPFAGARDPSCAEVEAPSRAAVGIMPPRVAEEAPELVLAATDVSRRFFECARDQILASGGRESPVNPAIDFLQSATGILLHERLGTTGNLVFATGKPDLESLVRTLLLEANDLPPSPHDRLDPLTGEGDVLAHATLVLPEHWLDAAGPEGARSPLRHARSAVAALRSSGEVKARILCAPAGCPELKQFAIRALSDLARRVPDGLGTPRWSETPGALEVELTGRISVLTPWLERLGLDPR